MECSVPLDPPLRCLQNTSCAEIVLSRSLRSRRLHAVWLIFIVYNPLTSVFESLTRAPLTGTTAWKCHHSMLWAWQSPDSPTDNN